VSPKLVLSKSGTLTGIFVVVLGLSAYSYAHAELGAGASRLKEAQQGLKARANQAVNTQNQTQQNQDPNPLIDTQILSDQTQVRQFLTSDGRVFAVSWAGASRPDLKTLFGDYYDRFQADNAASRKGALARGMSAHLSSTHADFIVRTFGRPGDVSGYALLPGLVPAGFDLQNLIEAQVEVKP
jgi:Protein of unknown function (DUF2844)